MNNKDIDNLLDKFMKRECTPADLRILNENPEVLERATKLNRSDFLPVLSQVKGEPYALDDYPQFKAMYDNDYTPEAMWLCGRQIGKTLWENDLCILSNGLTKKIKDVVPGDMILSVDHNYRAVVKKVTDKFDHGKLEVFKVKTRLGNVHHITQDHRLMTLYDHTPLNELSIGSRVAALRRGGKFTGLAKPGYRRIVLTAYILGDECCVNRRSISITALLPEVLEEIDRIAGWRQVNKTGTDAMACNCPSGDPIINALEEDGLIGHYSYNKFIPDWVFDLSEEDTRLFVSRLWATDGSVKKYRHTVSITYSSTSERLIYGLSSLLRKLGMLGQIRHKKASYKKDSKRVECRDVYELRIEGVASQALFLSRIDVPGKPAIDLCEVPINSNRDTTPIEIHQTLKLLFEGKTYNRNGVSLRDRKLRVKPKYPLSVGKLDKYIKYAEELGIKDSEHLDKLRNIAEGDIIWDTIESIESIGVQQAYDLEVEDTHVFAVSNGLITHNSINLSRSEIYDCIQIPHFQILYVAPLQSQTHRFSSLYLKEAIGTCRIARKLQERGGDAGPVAKAVGHQSFHNGAGIQLTYAKTSADRARGIFCDRMDCDELQDHLVDNLAIITQSLTQSKWGIRRYTGTAKTLDNTIEYYWRQSSMSEWCVKCDSCNHWNIPNMDGKVIEMIQPHGPCCVKCGTLLNTRTGVWIPANKDLVTKFPGYHIPQIMVPAIAEDERKWAELYHKVVKSPIAIVCQEILGISSSTGARLITQDDINKASVLPSTEVLQKRLKDYPVIVNGIDWGIAEQQSFTVQTVIGVRPDGKIHVLWAKRYVGFDTDHMLKDISRTHRYYNCQMMGADHGVGFTQNTMLANRFGLPVVQIQYTAQNQFMSYRPLLGYPRWCVSKVSALQMMFFAIRYGKILFPPQDEFKRYTDDLLSPYQEMRDDRGSERVYFSRNPNVPDDFANALCFAMLCAIQLTGDSLLDTLPEGAMGADVAYSGPPDTDEVDPVEILRPA